MEPGVLLLDKPEKMSSATAIARVKRALPQVKKIGHSGTLDPMATGLLICVLNGATRLARFAEAGEKVYSGTIDFGYKSDTNDIWGEVEAVAGGTLPSEADMSGLRERFLGRISQLPPKVSALKVEGKRAYKLARAGEEFELKPREVSVSELTFFDFTPQRVSFRIQCSKGFYVRAFARDIGEIFGCGAVLSSLRREASLPFHVRDATSLEELRDSSVQGWEKLFPSTPRVILGDEQRDYLKHGNLRLLETLRPALGQVPGDDTGDRQAVCLHQGTGMALGLLVKPSNGDWKIAVNLSVAN